MLIFRNLPVFNAPDTPPSGGAVDPAAQTAALGNGQLEQPAGAPQDASPEGNAEIDHLLGMFEAEESGFDENPIPVSQGEAAPQGQQPPVTEPKVEAPTAGSGAPQAQTQVAQQQQPGQATPPVQAAVAAPAAQPDGGTSPAGAVQQQQQAPEVQPTEVFGQLQQKLAEHQEVMLQELTSKVYALDDKMKEELIANPEAVVPKLMAQTHLNVTASVMRTLPQLLPMYVNGLLQANALNREKEDSFFEANKFLDRKNPEHKQAVVAVAQEYMKANPKATQADFIRDVGLYAAMRVKVNPLAAPAQQPGGQPQAAPQAAQLQVRTPGPVVRNVNPGYSPAGAHSAPGGQVQPPVNPMEEWMRSIQILEDNS